MLYNSFIIFWRLITLFYSFARELSRRLIQNEFSAILNGNHDAELNETTRVVSFSKESGASLNIVTLVNVGEFTDDMLFQLSAKSKFFLDDKLKYKNIIVLTLLISNTDTPATDAVIRSAESFYGQSVYTVFWKINLAAKEIKLSKKQPSEILNVRKLIQESIFAQNMRNDMSGRVLMRDIIKSAVEDSPFKPVDKSFTFTILFIALNAAIMFIIGIYGFDNPWNPIILFGALEPSRIFYDRELYRLISAIFLHSSLLHFAYNAVVLFVFGSRVEKYLGFGKFLAIYFLSGVCGSIASIFLTRSVGIGASGAIFGLISAAAAYSGVLGVSLDGLNFYTIIIFMITGIALGFVGENIDNFAHIGGMLAGIALGLLFAALKKALLEKNKN